MRSNDKNSSGNKELTQICEIKPNQLNGGLFWWFIHIKYMKKVSEMIKLPSQHGF